jgi:hypothetical protein
LIYSQFHLSQWYNPHPFQSHHTHFFIESTTSFTNYI